MRVAWILAKTRWRERPGTLLLLSLAMALAAAVPLGTNRAVQREVQHLRQQTQGIPLVAGAGDAGQTDLVLAAIHVLALLNLLLLALDCARWT